MNDHPIRGDSVAINLLGDRGHYDIAVTLLAL